MDVREFHARMAVVGVTDLLDVRRLGRGARRKSVGGHITGEGARDRGTEERHGEKGREEGGGEGEDSGRR